MSARKRSKGSLPKKCDAANPEQLEQVRKWIIAGHAEGDIREAIAEQWPDAESTPVIVAAMTHIASSVNCPMEAVLGWCIQATQFLYQRMVDVGDFPGALRAVKQLAEFARNYLPDEQQPGHTSHDGSP